MFTSEIFKQLNLQCGLFTIFEILSLLEFAPLLVGILHNVCYIVKTFKIVFSLYNNDKNICPC